MILRGSLFSQTLEMQTGVTIILPDDADAAPRQVCYLLHGLSGSNGDFTDYTMLPEYAKSRRTAFIMPEALRSFYTDMRHGQRFFTYISRELPELCRQVFNISSSRRDTTIMGVSMGGYGALKCALRHPERYGRCCAFAAAPLFLSEALGGMRRPGGIAFAREIYSEQLVADFQAAFGEELTVDPENDIPTLVRRVAALPQRPACYMACGDEDRFLPDHRRFVKETEGLGLDLTYEELPGSHNWPFFNAALSRALEWCDAQNAAK